MFYFNYILNLVRIFFFLDVSLILEIYEKEKNFFFEQFIYGKIDFLIFAFPILVNNLNLIYNQLIHLSCLDNLTVTENEYRFNLVYTLYSVNTTNKLNINILLEEETKFIPSLTHFYKSLYWLEREIFDMFGLIFIGNVDLRRILTDYGFQGNPLKKDFPLTGFFELRYSEFLKGVEYRDVVLFQEYRLLSVD